MTTRWRWGPSRGAVALLAVAVALVSTRASGETRGDNWWTQDPGEGDDGSGPELPPLVPPYLALAQQAMFADDLDHATDLLVEAQTCWARHGEACGFTSAEYRAVAGALYLELGEVERAIELFEASTEEDPQRPVVWFYLGQALYRAQRYGPAADALRLAADAAADDPHYHALLARAEWLAGRPEGARLALDEGLRRFPADPPLLRDTALLFARLGYHDVAVSFGERHADALGSDDPDGLRFLADLLRTAHRSGEARVTLERAALLAPDDPVVREHLALACAEDDLPHAAARLLQPMVEGTPRLAPLAIEQLLLARHPADALRVSAFVDDPAEQARHRARIHLDAGSPARAVAILLPLWRGGTSSAEDRLLLAHAALRCGRPELVLSVLHETEPGSKEGASRPLIDAAIHCRDYPWDCL